MSNQDESPKVVVLTPCQLEIVRLISEGNTTKEVALALGRSVKTVDYHRSNIMRKVNVGNVAGLVRYAIRNLIIRPWNV